MTILVCAAAHFLVDFACAYAYFAYASPHFENWALLALVYNFCAFALQAPFGFWVDKTNRNAAMAALGCLIAAAGCGFGFQPLAMVILMGIGNALFHAGAAVDILNISSEKAAPLGCYVGPGAIGLFLGAASGASRVSGSAVWPMLALITAAVIVLLRQYNQDPYFRSGNATVKASWDVPRTALAAMLLLFTAVLLRSYIGFLGGFGWNEGTLALVLVLAAAAGKILGGFAADRFGFMTSATLPLLAAAFLFGGMQNPVCGLLAVLCINISMPITLWTAAKLMPDKKGTSFGLLSVALFVGFLPRNYDVLLLPAEPLSAAASSFAAMLVLYAALRFAGDVIKPVDQSSPTKMQTDILDGHTVIS